MQVVADPPRAAEAVPEISGRQRVAIEQVTPQIDGGRFAIKRVVGDSVAVEADVFADGYDAVCCRLRYRREGEPEWACAPMQSRSPRRWAKSPSRRGW